MQIDFPYIIFILILISFTLLSFKGRDKRMFKYSCILTFLFIGLRAPIVGADTWDYYRFFVGIRSYYNEDQRDLEPLFLVYVRILQTLTLKTGILIQLMNTFFSFITLYLLIKSYSQYKTLSVLLFFLICSWPIYFVALRQILALSLVLFGVYSVMTEKKNKWIIYMICTLLGWGFHTSAILAGIVYAILYFVPFNSRLLAIISIVISALVGIAFEMLDIDVIFSAALSYSGFLTERMDSYLEFVKYIDEKPSSFLILSRKSIVAIMAFLLLPKSRMSHWFSKIYLVGICTNNLFFSVNNIARGVLPLTIFGMIVVSWAIYSIKELKPVLRRGVSYIVVLFFLYFVRAFVVGNINYDIYDDAKMHTYQFFFEDYSKNPIFKHPDIQ